MRNVSLYQDMKLLLSGGLPKYKEVQFNKNITNSALVYSVIQNVYKNIR